MRWERFEHRANGRQDIVRVSIAKSGLVCFSLEASKIFNPEKFDYVEFYLEQSEKAVGFKFVKEKGAFTRKVNWCPKKYHIRQKIGSCLKILEVPFPKHSYIFEPYLTDGNIVVVYKQKDAPANNERQAIR